MSAVEDAVAAIAGGGMVVVVDAPGRENEGDLVMAGEKVTPEAINFMATHGRGLICAPMLRERLCELGIPPMVGDPTDPHETAFHVGVDLRSGSTGISASERAATIRALASPDARATDFTQPGHVFPLAYRDGGVLRRSGHTEASIDLAILAGLAPAAAICEIARSDGEMARMSHLLPFARRHGLPVVAISDLIDLRRRREQLVTRVTEARMPIAGAEFRIVGYRDVVDGREHVALLLGEVADARAPLVRMHSECLTGDVFGSLRCDCGRQLRLAIEAIARDGVGAVVYLRSREARARGLLSEVHAEGDRDWGAGAQILRDLGIARLRLLTSGPAERSALEDHGLTVVDRVALRAPVAA
jgi:3,4-dihydroxy 2-butanone 4-phosphate synthase / GTP cyclohydrolase II